MVHQTRSLKHVAIIMDGNGRWAQSLGKARTEGHKAGAASAREIITHAAQSGIKHLTLYAFSTENWSRPKAEVTAIFSLIEHFLRRELQELKQHGIRISVIGDTASLPTRLRFALRTAIRATIRNTGLELVFAINYGGRAEIARVAKIIAQRSLMERGDLSRLNERTMPLEFESKRPAPDLVIRTGGEQRLSNFLLWQAAYAEWVFTPTPWPDYGVDEFERHLATFEKRERRFGGVGEAAFGC